MNEPNVRKDIRALSREELRAVFAQAGDKPYRADQVYDWLWNKSLKNFEEMTNLSKATRTWLEEHYTINHIRVDDLQRSADGTIKNAVKLHDGLVVESVLIPAEKRITACVSSQVGCSLNCAFCATARLKRMRNLNPDEIYDQVAVIREQAVEYFGGEKALRKTQRRDRIKDLWAAQNGFFLLRVRYYLPIEEIPGLLAAEIEQRWEAIRRRAIESLCG